MLFYTYLWSIIFLSSLFIGFIWCAHSRRGMIPLLLLGIVWNACLPYGLVWNGAKVLVICIVALWFLKPEPFPRLSDSINPSMLILLCLYVIGMTGI